MASVYPLPTPDKQQAGLRVISESEPFLMIPWSVYDQLEGEGAAQLVLLALMRHAGKGGECWPSVETLCKLSGKSDRYVRDAINRLVELGIIAKERRTVGGMKSGNTYRIVQKSPEDKSGTMYRSTGNSCRSDRQYVPLRPAVCTDELEPVEPKPIEVIPPTGDNPLPPVDPVKAKPQRTKKAPEYGADFLTGFWAIYPSHERNTKTDAWEQWQRMTPEDRADAVAVLPQFAATDSWRRGFAPAAHRWLAKRKWEDPPKPQAATGSGLAIVGGEVRTGGAAKGGMTPAEIREYGRRRAAQEAGGQ